MYVSTNKVPLLQHLVRQHQALRVVDNAEPDALRLTPDHIRQLAWQAGDFILRSVMSKDEIKTAKTALTPESYRLFCVEKLQEQVDKGKAAVLGMVILSGVEPAMRRANQEWTLIELPS